MKRIVLITLALALFAPSAALAKEKGKSGGSGGNGGGNNNNNTRDLVLKKGTMELGGSATLDVASYDGSTAWGLYLNPQVGYFVKKGFELFGGVNLNYVKIEDIDAATGYGLNAGARYFIDMKPNWAYVGGAVGFAPESDLALASSYNVDALGGILMPLSKNVALDLGATLGILKYDGMDKSYIQFSGGYLGIHGFFRQ
jgi:hypothetical protein